jgi:hypothetical protein
MLTVKRRGVRAVERRDVTETLEEGGDDMRGGETVETCSVRFYRTARDGVRRAVRTSDRERERLERDLERVS